MTQRDRSTIDIDARPVPIEFAPVSQSLSRKGFVDLDQVEVAQFEVRTL